MKTYSKIGLIASLIFVPIILIASSTGVFAAERISDSELATLYGGTRLPGIVNKGLTATGALYRHILQTVCRRKSKRISICLALAQD